VRFTGERSHFLEITAEDGGVEEEARREKVEDIE
jgi:hypothetical protein